jgi:FixJ family two-component response regulator
LSGRELAGKLRERKNNLKIIYTSGYSPDVVNQNLSPKDEQYFLAKPYHPDKLIQTVRRCLDESTPVQDQAASADL